MNEFDFGTASSAGQATGGNDRKKSQFIVNYEICFEEGEKEVWVQVPGASFLENEKTISVNDASDVRYKMQAGLHAFFNETASKLAPGEEKVWSHGDSFRAVIKRLGAKKELPDKKEIWELFSKGF